MTGWFSTTTVSRDRQYDRWRDAVRSTHEAWDMPRRAEGRFDGRVRSRTLGPASVIACSCDPCEGERGRVELARTERASVGVLLLLAGAERLTHPSGAIMLQAGQFALWDTTRPLSFDMPGRLRKITLMLPADALSPTLGTIRDWRRVFDARRGCGALLAAQLQAVAGLDQDLDGSSQQAVLRGLLELVRGAILEQSTSPRTASARLVRRARAYIEGQLDDPALNAERAALALHVSRRQLDRAFAETGSTITRFIWSQRLERCRRDLRLDLDATVSEIAFRWGFSDAAHFSRTFRTTFGVSPTAYRAACGGSGST